MIRPASVFSETEPLGICPSFRFDRPFLLASLLMFKSLAINMPHPKIKTRRYRIQLIVTCPPFCIHSKGEFPFFMAW
ncbi:hypothetical protein, partial [Gluconobacter albidus]